MDRAEKTETEAPGRPAAAEIVGPAPEVGMVHEIAPGVLLLPMSVPFPPGTQNALALADRQNGREGWTIIDPGYGRAETLWRTHLTDALGDKPVFRVIATHFHPDHIGLAGWLQRTTGAALWTTRTSWLQARMLQLDGWTTPPETARAFHRRLGYDAEMLARYEIRAARNFSVTVSPLPIGYRRIRAGDMLEIGERRFEIFQGDGHAPEHAVLWDRAGGLLIAGDQILPEISPNIGVYPMEPEADPMSEWLDSCDRLGGLLADDVLTVPGHGPAFRGAARRCTEMARRTRARLDRLARYLARGPFTAVECFGGVYGRRLPEEAEGLASVETLAHLNHLAATGRALRSHRSDGVWLWRAA